MTDVAAPRSNSPSKKSSLSEQPSTDIGPTQLSENATNITTTTPPTTSTHSKVLISSNTMNPTNSTEITSTTHDMGPNSITPSENIPTSLSQPTASGSIEKSSPVPEVTSEKLEEITSNVNSGTNASSIPDSIPLDNNDQKLEKSTIPSNNEVDSVKSVEMSTATPPVVSGSNTLLVNPSVATTPSNSVADTGTVEDKTAKSVSPFEPVSSKLKANSAKSSLTTSQAPQNVANPESNLTAEKQPETVTTTPPPTSTVSVETQPPVTQPSDVTATPQAELNTSVTPTTAVPPPISQQSSVTAAPTEAPSTSPPPSVVGSIPSTTSAQMQSSSPSNNPTSMSIPHASSAVTPMSSVTTNATPGNPAPTLVEQSPGVPQAQGVPGSIAPAPVLVHAHASQRPVPTTMGTPGSVQVPGIAPGQIPMGTGSNYPPIHPPHQGPPKMVGSTHIPRGNNGSLGPAQRRGGQDLRKNRRGFGARPTGAQTDFPFPKNLPKLVKNRPPNSRVFIGNLASEHTSTHEIISLFHKYGTLIEEPVLRRSFGFVQYSCAEEAHAAVDGEDGTLIGGLPMDLSIADNREVKKFTHVQNNTPFPHNKGNNGQGPQGPQGSQGQHGQYVPSRRRDREPNQQGNQPLPKRRRRSISPPPGKKGGVHPPQYRRQRPEPRNGIYLRVLCMSPTAEKYARHCEATFRSMTGLHADVAPIVSTGLGEALGRAMREGIPYVMVVASKDVEDGTCTIRTLEKTGYEKCGRGNGVIPLREAVEVCLIERGIIVPSHGMNNHFNNAPSHPPPQPYYQPYGQGVGAGGIPPRINGMPNNQGRGPMASPNVGGSAQWLSQGMNQGGVDRPAWMSGPRAPNVGANGRGANNVPPMGAPTGMHSVPNTMGSRNNMPTSNAMMSNNGPVNNGFQYPNNVSHNAGYPSNMNASRGGYHPHPVSGYGGSNTNHMGSSRMDNDPSRGGGYDGQGMPPHQGVGGNHGTSGAANDYSMAGNMGTVPNEMNMQGGYMDRYTGGMGNQMNGVGSRGNYGGRDEYDPTAPSVGGGVGRHGGYNGGVDNSQMNTWGRQNRESYDMGREVDNSGIGMGQEGYQHGYGATQHQQAQHSAYNDQRGQYNRGYDRRSYGQGPPPTQAHNNMMNTNSANTSGGASGSGYEGGFRRQEVQGYGNGGRWGDQPYGGVEHSMQAHNSNRPAGSESGNHNSTTAGTVDIGKLTNLISAFQQKQQQAQSAPQNYHHQNGPPPPPPPPNSAHPYQQRPPYRNMNNRWNGR